MNRWILTISSLPIAISLSACNATPDAPVPASLVQPAPSPSPTADPSPSPSPSPNPSPSPSPSPTFVSRPWNPGFPNGSGCDSIIENVATTGIGFNNNDVSHYDCGFLHLEFYNVTDAGFQIGTYAAGDSAHMWFSDFGSNCYLYWTFQDAQHVNHCYFTGEARLNQDQTLDYIDIGTCDSNCSNCSVPSTEYCSLVTN